MRLGAPFGRLLAVWIALALFLGLVIAGFGSLTYRDWTTEAFFFWRQDVPVLVACIALTAALGLAPATWLARARWPGGPSPRVWVGLLAAVCLIAGWIGWRLVFEGYAFSLDEFLANFDAQDLRQRPADGAGAAGLAPYVAGAAADVHAAAAERRLGLVLPAGERRDAGAGPAGRTPRRWSTRC